MGASRVIFLVSACVCSRKQSAGHPPYELWLVCTRHEALKVSPLLLLLPLLHAPAQALWRGWRSGRGTGSWGGTAPSWGPSSSSSRGATSSCDVAGAPFSMPRILLLQGVGHFHSPSSSWGVLGRRLLLRAGQAVHRQRGQLLGLLQGIRGQAASAGDRPQGFIIHQALRLQCSQRRTQGQMAQPPPTQPGRQTPHQAPLHIV